MTTTITATYDNVAALANVVDELVNDGLEREKVYSDEEKKQIKVMVHGGIEASVTEILKRHNPTQIS